MAQPATVSWVDPRLVVYESGIEGRGEFAAAEIDAGEVIKRLGGRLISGTEMQRIATSGERYSAYRVGPDSHLLMAWDDPASRGNHSCEPNSWFVSTFEVATRRAVAVAEEVTIDYATLTVDPDWSMSCRCGAQTCRKVVSGEDWRLSELRERYRGHFVPWIESLKP